MKVSLNWLKDYVNLPCSAHDFSEAMTMSGTKVEGYEILEEKLHGIVVGKLLSVVPHPDSDHMVVCQVEVGGERPLQIVTGAQNVKEGDLVPVCTNGSLLPDGKTIKTGKLRGVLSEGMLCSLGELGLTTHDFPYAIEDGISSCRRNASPATTSATYWVCGTPSLSLNSPSTAPTAFLTWASPGRRRQPSISP